MATIFLTGGTGFIGKRLLKILGKVNKIFLLVRRESAGRAEKIIKESGLKDIKIVEGDLEQEKFGVPDGVLRKITQETDYVYHLAASYDSSLSKERIFEINLEGTKRLALLAKKIKNLKGFVYVSTAHVAGTREGRILEDLPTKPPIFHNFYEEAKFKAEVFLKKTNLPLVVIRPAMVLGDSKTGEFDKEVKSGNYKLIKMIDKGLFFFYPGKCDGFIAAVPIDWVVRMILEIGQNPKSIGKIFYLADPNPMTARELINRVCELLNKRKPALEIPLTIIKFLPKSRVKTQMLMLNLRQSFDISHTLSLVGKKGSPPSLVSYLPVLINYYKKFLR